MKSTSGDQMQTSRWPRTTTRIAQGIGVALAAVVIAIPAHAQTIRDVHVDYDVLFNGVSIGSFQFQNQMSGQRYTASSKAEGRLLFGALKWNGTFSGSGRIVTDRVYPRRFSQTFQSRRRLAFRTKKKFKSADVEFDRKGAVTAKLNPPLKTHERVPLEPGHKLNVFDPIGAIISMTQTNVARPCSARLPVFEGRLRFDIVMALKGREPVRGENGRTFTGYVCSVRYVPVAGHRLKDAKSALTRPGAIELVLRVVPEADLLIPHELRLATQMGSATVRARKIDIRTNGRGRIVLNN